MDNEKLSILRLLIENKDKDFSIRQIAQKRKINYKSAYNALYMLEKEGIVELKRVGNSFNCHFNFKFNDSVFLVEYERREELIRNKKIKLIQEDLSKLNMGFIALVFGSYAKKNARSNSDIDLLVIGGDKKKIERKISLYHTKIHLTYFSNEEFDAMLKSKEFTVVSEAVKDNVILVGIEDYYRRLENAR